MPLKASLCIHIKLIQNLSHCTVIRSIHMRHAPGGLKKMNEHWQQVLRIHLVHECWLELVHCVKKLCHTWTFSLLCNDLRSPRQVTVEQTQQQIRHRFDNVSERNDSFVSAKIYEDQRAHDAVSFEWNLVVSIGICDRFRQANIDQLGYWLTLNHNIQYCAHTMPATGQVTYWHQPLPYPHPHGNIYRISPCDMVFSVK